MSSPFSAGDLHENQDNRNYFVSSSTFPLESDFRPTIDIETEIHVLPLKGYEGFSRRQKRF
jgi:hypothetical protein